MRLIWPFALLCYYLFSFLFSGWTWCHCKWSHSSHSQHWTFGGGRMFFLFILRCMTLTAFQGCSLHQFVNKTVNLDISYMLCWKFVSTLKCLLTVTEKLLSLFIRVWVQLPAESRKSVSIRRYNVNITVCFCANKLAAVCVDIVTISCALKKKISVSFDGKPGIYPLFFVHQ